MRIGTKIGASFALALAIFAAIGLISYQGTVKLIETSRRESHSYRVLGELEDLLSVIKDAETGQRGFIITGEQRYLEPYNSATVLIKENFNDLRTLTVETPEQQQRLDDLELLLDRKIAELQATIELRESQGFNAALQVVLTDQGKQIMSNIRNLLAEMETAEREVLKQRSLEAQTATQQTLSSIVYGLPLTFILLTIIGFFFTRNISQPLREISDAAEKLAAGDLSVGVPNTSKRRDEIGVLTHTFNQMIANLRATDRQNYEQNWLKSNLAKFSHMLQGQRNLEAVTKLILSELAPLVGAQHGVFYVMDTFEEQPLLQLYSSYAYQKRKHLANQFRLGEGLVGQCALEKQKIFLTEVPADYIQIGSGLGAAKPLSIIVSPVLFETKVTAVIELASFQAFDEIHLTFLDQLTESIGIIINTIASDMRTEQLLKQSQALTEELQCQQEELKQSNESLEQQAQSLQISEQLLKQQQEELQQTNEELEEKAELLSRQNQQVADKNHQIEQARRSLEEKAAQLALSSRYKSEFLANMSHELRTPLNSLLILAKLLTDNVEGNLSSKQVEYSQTIYAAGQDLLALINDILDLAKIESGTMSLEVNQLQFTDLREHLERTFGQIAQSKELNFAIELAEQLPTAIYTDAKRLQQILKNLLANAFKFTERGEVRLQVESVKQGWSSTQATLNQADTVLAFTVSDTGIGIAADKQQIIFEAFQQADGSTSRKYGGTGLGLSICREIAQLLGGEIHLSSQLGQGSRFTLYLPQEKVRAEVARTVVEDRVDDTAPASLLTPPTSPLADDRSNVQPGDRLLLVVEDDINFARILLDMAQEQGFKVIVAQDGSTGLALAREFKPQAILLDIKLPVMDGWTVLERLKQDPSVRHIPVHILSVESEQRRSLQQGAIAYLQKPVTSETITETLTGIKQFINRQVKHLLVVEDDAVQRRSIVDLIGDRDVQISAVGTGAAALAALSSTPFDCVVLDLGLPDMTGFELIEQIKQVTAANLPIIVYTGKELTRAEETELRRMAETIIIKDVRSPERLLEETALFLHRVQENLAAPQRQMLEQLQQRDHALAGKKVLIVDDDVRNIFALTSMLERQQMQVLYAETGSDGITELQRTPDVDLVLMDVMMPEMDGYETMHAIRNLSQFRSLPIIALTAKAMKGDREKCIAAGASDYITKPVDPEQLLSLLRVWLYR